MTEQEMQTKFINENMDVLQKYLIWREAILQPQILEEGVDMPAIDTEVVDLTDKFHESFNGTSGTSGVTEEIAKNYGIIN